MRLKSGISSFVLDDGWFGNHDDNQTLSDWTVNEEKLGGSLAGAVKASMTRDFNLAAGWSQK